MAKRRRGPPGGKLPWYCDGPCKDDYCYACDARATGYRDRRPEGGQLEYACSRHRDPWIETYDACTYCGGPVRKGSLIIDGRFAHHRCEQEASRGF